jgi:hypothetical protein
VYKIIQEVPREEGTPLEEHVTKLSEAIHGFCTKINDLEAQHIPGTPPEEREQREKLATTNLENIRSLVSGYTKIYVEIMGDWTQLTEDMELYVIGEKLQVVQDKAHRFK